MFRSNKFKISKYQGSPLGIAPRTPITIGVNSGVLRKEMGKYRNGVLKAVQIPLKSIGFLIAILEMHIRSFCSIFSTGKVPWSWYWEQLSAMVLFRAISYDKLLHFSRNIQSVWNSVGPLIFEMNTHVALLPVCITSSSFISSGQIY